MLNLNNAIFKAKPLASAGSMKPTSYSAIFISLRIIMRRCLLLTTINNNCRLSSTSTEFQIHDDHHRDHDNWPEQIQTVKPYHQIPGVTSMPVIGTSWSFIPFIGKLKC